jgi:hypothetical protein
MECELHFVWRSNTLEMGLERIIWNTGQLARLCKELEIGCLGNLCNCVTDEVFKPSRGRLKAAIGHDMEVTPQIKNLLNAVTLRIKIY